MSIPKINLIENGPIVISGIDYFIGPDGNRHEIKEKVIFCRCGKTQTMPLCDGTHRETGYLSEKERNDCENRIRDFEGKEIIVHYCPRLCSHDGCCMRKLPRVFNKKRHPWIQPDNEPVEKIIELIKQCPSGALTYTLRSGCAETIEMSPSIKLQKGGPLEVRGYIIIEDKKGTKPYCPTRYTLCRCGASKNKPFCDGSHIAIAFQGKNPDEVL